MKSLKFMKLLMSLIFGKSYLDIFSEYDAKIHVSSRTWMSWLYPVSFINKMWITITSWESSFLFAIFKFWNYNISSPRLVTNQNIKWEQSSLLLYSKLTEKWIHAFFKDMNIKWMLRMFRIWIWQKFEFGRK